jgi:hypothetical protein
MKCFGSNSNEKGFQKRCHNQIRNVYVSKCNEMLQISIGIVDLEMVVAVICFGILTIHSMLSYPGYYIYDSSIM